MGDVDPKKAIDLPHRRPTMNGGTLRSELDKNALKPSIFVFPFPTRSCYMKILSVGLTAVITYFSCNTFALAHCRDARKTCVYTFDCMKTLPDQVENIDEGSSAGDGHRVWLTLHACEVRGLTYWDGHGGHRKFNDISAGCTDPDLASVGRFAIQVREGNPYACDQLPR